MQPGEAAFIDNANYMNGRYAKWRQYHWQVQGQVGNNIREIPLEVIMVKVKEKERERESKRGAEGLLVPSKEQRFDRFFE